MHAAPRAGKFLFLMGDSTRPCTIAPANARGDLGRMPLLEPGFTPIA
jgi:hypothetical protein